MSDAPRWSVEGRDWPNRTHSQFVEAAGLCWHVQRLGEGPVLLLLHGTGAATHSWRDLAPLLAEGFTVVAPDLPGHGFTRGRPRDGMTMTAMARATSELMRVLAQPPQFIVAHSAGAAIAARMALDHLAVPELIVGLGAALLPFPGAAAALFPTLARLLFVNPFAPHLFAGFARGGGETARFLLRSTGSRIDDVGLDCYTRLFATPAHCAGAIAMMADWDLDALARDLPRLHTPLRLLHGDRDRAIPIDRARAAVALVPGGRLTILPGLGHLAHEERPIETAQRIRAMVEAR
ncbi:alpha/beta fold hydrolase BchO [Sphingomonas sp. RS6]